MEMEIERETARERDGEICVCVCVCTYDIHIQYTIYGGIKLASLLGVIDIRASYVWSRA